MKSDSENQVLQPTESVILKLPVKLVKNHSEDELISLLYKIKFRTTKLGANANKKRQTMEDMCLLCATFFYFLHYFFCHFNLYNSTLFILNKNRHLYGI